MGAWGTPDVPSQEIETIESLPPSQIVEGEDHKKVGVAASTLHMNLLPLVIPSQQTDILYVDGRYRIACALLSLLYIHPESVLLIHDYWNRPHYVNSKLTVDFYEVIDESCRDASNKCSMVLMKPRKGVVEELQAAHAKVHQMNAVGRRPNLKGVERKQNSNDVAVVAEDDFPVVPLWQRELSRYRKDMH
eukprot:GHVS01058242.1.p1 GENE.GHVS01058242.1~~GHVS01058242.1.p1  ORF type:complete len:190 (-),score=23.68 GHVS01058242.1:159-728(-)